MKQLLTDSMIRYQSEMGCRRNGPRFLWEPEASAFPFCIILQRKPLCRSRKSKETTEAAVIEAPTEAETESVWIPTLDELNLAHYFPEGEEDSDITKSLAGHVFHELMTRDANWSSALYSYSDVTPADMAAKLGISRERILGKYNPEDESHQKENPSTWTIGSFRNVKIQAVDGDGHSRFSLFQRTSDHVNGQRLYLLS